jgi:hypothetical protein
VLPLDLHLAEHTVPPRVRDVDAEMAPERRQGGCGIGGYGQEVTP